MTKQLETILGDHIGMEYSTNISMRKQSNGEWLVVQSVIQKRSDDLETWDERREDFTAKDKQLEQAIGEAAVLATLFLESINYDIFSLEEVSLDAEIKPKD